MLTKPISVGDSFESSISIESAAIVRMSEFFKRRDENDVTVPTVPYRMINQRQKSLWPEGTEWAVRVAQCDARRACCVTQLV